MNPRCPTVNRIARIALIAGNTCLSMAGGGAVAQDSAGALLRDPMSAPPGANTAPANGRNGGAGTTAATAAPAMVQVRQLLVINGQRYVIDNGRRRGVGDLLGSARIERIDDSGVLLRQGSVQWRVPLFAGVIKRPVPEAAQAPPRTTVAQAAPARKNGAAGEKP